MNNSLKVFETKVNNLKIYEHFIESRCINLDETSIQNHLNNVNQKLVIQFETKFNKKPSVVLSIEGIEMNYKLVQKNKKNYDFNVNLETVEKGDITNENFVFGFMRNLEPDQENLVMKLTKMKLCYMAFIRKE